MDVGVIGLNSRAVAESAMRAGLGAYLVGYYSDIGSGIPEERRFSMQGNPLEPDLGNEYSAGGLVDFAIERLAGLVDAVIPTSAIGCNPSLLGRLESEFKILGNGSRRVERVRRWKSLEKILRDSGAEFPETVAVRSVGEMEMALERTGLPAVIKSPAEGGGMGQRLLRSGDGIEGLAWTFERLDEVLVQEYVRGVPVSSSALSDGENAVAVSVNRQIIGLGEFNALKEFTYCGNVVPLDSGINDRIAGLTEDIISNAGLVGSNGIDYVLAGDRIFFMEINCRLQDTLECVERYRGVNLVERHLAAIDGDLSLLEFKSRRCFGKGILFAGERIGMGGISGAEGVYDVPPSGSVIRDHEPVCSIITEGENNEEVIGRLIEKSRAVLSRFSSPCRE